MSTFNFVILINSNRCSPLLRVFLCLFAGGARQELPKGLGTEAGARNEVEYSRRRYTPKRQPFLSCYHLHVFIYVVFERFSERFKDLKGKNVKRSRDWIVEKKERRRRQGRSVLSHPILSISLLLHKLLFGCFQGGASRYKVHGSSTTNRILKDVCSRLTVFLFIGI